MTSFLNTQYSAVSEYLRMKLLRKWVTFLEHYHEMIGTIFYVLGTKTQQKTCWTDFVVGLKDVSNSLTYIFLEVKGWHGRNKRSLNYHTREE